MTPQQIGRYEIKAELGRGGMAIVYRAHDPRFERQVAIKVLPREFLFDEGFRYRFEREAKAIAALEHGAIVPVYDFGEEDGQPYLVMRFMPGGSLADRLRGGPLALAETTRIIERIAAALDFAHLAGLVHRDIKPANIMFDAAGEACLSDFGIVKLSEATAQLTGSGIVGTPAYMAPEMARLGGVTPLVDVYALGVTLFQMLTGNLPYLADTPMGLLMAHVTTPIPDILEVRPDLSPGVQAVIERALAKDPAGRYPSAGELAAALRAIPETARVDFAAGGPTVVETVVEPEEGERLAAAEPVGATTLEEGPDATLLPGDTWQPVRSPEMPSERQRAPRPAPPPAPRRRRASTGWWIVGAMAVVAAAIGLLATDVLGRGDELAAAFDPAMNSDDCASAGLPEAACSGVAGNADWSPTIQEFDGVPMALVPAGCFQMGSRGTGDSDERPVHQVCLDRPFWIDVTEVTNAQFAAFAGQSVRSSNWTDPDNPRETITWFEAATFCQQRDARLPTEAEWEYAARGPDGLVFPWGNEFIRDNVVYRSTANASRPEPVGSRPDGAAWVGALDMSGNVDEWVADWLGPYSPEQQLNPTGQGSGTYRVIRGGSFARNDDLFLRAAWRGGVEPTGLYSGLGFRCARDVEPGAAGTSQYPSPPTDSPTPISPADDPSTPSTPASVTHNADWTPYTQNFDGVEMALVPAGCFQMGSEDGGSAEQPIHEVCFNEPFWIDVYEVINARFASFLDARGNQSEGGVTWLDADAEDVLIRESGGTWIPTAGYENHPAIELTWYGAAAYCDWLGKRLPTEAEWEYAARGPDGLIYPWGNEFVAEYVVYGGNSGGQTAEVGSRPGGVSWAGAYDLSGNVWEWVNDWWHGSYPSEQQVNPQGPDSGTYRVLRGGSWHYDEVIVRAAVRHGFNRDYTDDDLGFRCARSY